MQKGLRQIWPVNAPAVRLALACATQWRWCPHSGEPLGLIYEGVDRAARWLGLDMDADLFGRLAIIEEELIRLLRVEHA